MPLARFAARTASMLACAAAAAALAAPPATKDPRAGVPYGAREDVRAFAAEVAADGALDRRDVERTLAQARFRRDIVDLMQRPYVDPPKWYDYAPPFLAPERVAAGLAWWKANEDALARAEARWGVPASIVVAIVGIETYYGRYTGRHRVIDALATLAFDYPRRAPFFRGELKEYLLLAREQGVSPLAPTGSYAGAMGLPQFMPGSYRRYAVDFDGDAKVDLWKSEADVIGSVANYLARHDWTPGGPTLVPARIDDAQRERMLRRLDGGLSERRPLAAWAEDGVEPALAAEYVDEPVALLMLEDEPGAASYWIAYPNFYVITRYNRSRLYATAVIRLAEALEAGR
jgi:membrane-bound lytic murein transglycosylase B